jgi:hypothetical protein
LLMDVVVKTMTGQAVPVAGLSRNATAYDVKRRLEQNTAISLPPSQLRLIYMGAELADSRVLSQASASGAPPIQTGAVLQVAMRMHPVEPTTTTTATTATASGSAQVYPHHGGILNAMSGNAPPPPPLQGHYMQGAGGVPMHPSHGGNGGNYAAPPTQGMSLALERERARRRARVERQKTVNSVIMCVLL